MTQVSEIGAFFWPKPNNHFFCALKNSYMLYFSCAPFSRQFRTGLAGNLRNELRKLLALKVPTKPPFYETMLILPLIGTLINWSFYSKTVFQYF